MSDFTAGNYIKISFSLFLIFLSTLLFSQSPSFLPENFFDQEVGSDWQRPVGITFDDNGRGYVWEKRGTVYLLENGLKLNQPLIDISDEVGDWGDHGMLGFVLHPDFLTNGYFYLLYVVDRHHVEAFGTSAYDPEKNLYNQASIGRITRYQADILTGFSTLKPNSRKVLLGEGFEDGFPIIIGSHGIGTMAFGDDGTLFASCGDGGSFESIDGGNAEETYYLQALEDGMIRPEENVGAFKSQMVRSLAGKIIRIDAETGLGLPSNPFYETANPESKQSKVWVLGFRNPFRFIAVKNTGSSDPAIGDPGTLLIGDVGSSSWEELNIAETGGINFGWPIYEGFEPHWGYFHLWTPNRDEINPLGQAGVCGDHFNFQDLIYPSTLRREDVPNSCDSNQVIPNNVHSFIHRRPVIAWSGKLWNHPPRAKKTDFDELGDPIVHQVDDPEAEIEADNYAGFTSIPGFFYEGDQFPQEYQGLLFEADLSGWIRTFQFNEENEVTKIEAFASWEDKGVVHIAQNPADGCIYWCHVYSNEVHKICYGGNPPPLALAKANRLYGPSPLEVQFQGDESYDPDGGAISYFWDFGDGTSSEAPNPNHTFTTENGQLQTFEVLLTVTDTGGLATTETIFVSLNNTPPEVSINNLTDSSFYSISGASTLPLTATVVDLEHSEEELTYSWEIFFHHNDHYHPEAPVNKTETFMVIDPVGCGTETYWYRARLTVTDANGLSNFDEKELFPYCGDPIAEIAPLEGRIAPGAIHLDWTTLFEDKVEKFEVERSLDTHFEKIGEVSANSGFNGVYQFVDDQPLNGINKYRVKAVNAQGIYEYSNIIALEYPPKLDLAIAPNPTNDRLSIFIGATTSSKVEFKLFNSLGQQVRSYSWESIVGGALDQTISLSTLPNGLYVYQLLDGEVEVVEELIIMK